MCGTTVTDAVTVIVMPSATKPAAATSSSARPYPLRSPLVNTTAEHPPPLLQVPAVAAVTAAFLTARLRAASAIASIAPCAAATPATVITLVTAAVVVSLRIANAPITAVTAVPPRVVATSVTTSITNNSATGIPAIVMNLKRTPPLFLESPPFTRGGLAPS